MRIGLNVLETKKKRVRTQTKLPRAALMKLTARLMEAKSLAAAARIVGRTAAKTPPAPPSIDRRTGKLVYWADWSRMLTRLAKGLADGEPRFPIITLDGNGKLPFASFSTVPKWTCPGAGDCVNWCYSFTAWRHAAPYCRQVQNTLLLRHAPQLVREAFLKLPGGLVFRLYVDGDFEDEQTLAFWMGLLKERPDVRAYGYSKSWEVIWNYASQHVIPANYLLNLSSGGRPQTVTVEQMLSLPFVRADFLSLDIDYRPHKKGKVGFERFDDPAYHAAVREAATARGLRVFSCPGRCGDCAGGDHACGNVKFKGVTIALGIH